MDLDEITQVLNNINWAEVTLVYVGAATFLTPILFLLFLNSIRKRRRLLKQAKAENELTKDELQNQVDNLKAKYSNIIDAEEAVKNEQQELSKITSDLEKLKSEYNEKRPYLSELKKQMAVLDDKLALAELGIYEPSFYFDDSEDFQHEINEVKEFQKHLVQEKLAVIVTTEWSVDGSLSKGKTMSNRNVRLTLRAFNNECAAAIANVKWNNANAMLKRIENARHQIDKANASNHVEITDAYYELKVKELKLTYEYREKRQQEKDLAKEVARQEREEQRLIKDAEKARKEEEQYEKLLKKVRAEVGLMTAEEHHKEIDRLQDLLDKAHEKTERAEAMAERTRSGFVYVISNVGSFGENVIKIGLTRRVDPFDRVKELGDASVPFLFDIHAMIYSDNAPELEDALHKEFADKRINMSNMRKEFFKVGIPEVEDAVKRLSPDANFFKDVEAREFKETILKREQLLQDISSEQKELPDEL